jgi:uncharacterized protein (DUF2336 family)
MTASTAILNDVQRSLAAGSVNDRDRLVRYVTDLFLVNAAALREEDIGHFDDVLNTLIREIDVAARALLALRLALVRNAPVTLMRALANDNDPTVARPVLAHSGRLDEATLVTVARTRGQEHLLAISQRETISEPVVDVLVERGDAQVLLSVAGNAGAMLSQPCFARLVERAEGQDDLAERIARRKDIPPALFALLIRTASEQVRVRLEAELPHAAADIRRSVEAAAVHVARKQEAEVRDLEAVRAAVAALHQGKRLDDEQVRTFAEDGLLEEVKVALALMSDLPATFIDQALKQESGEMLSVIARATGLAWATVRAIVQLPIWRHPATPSEIRGCLRRYEKLGRPTASEIMRFYKSRL